MDAHMDDARSERGPSEERHRRDHTNQDDITEVQQVPPLPLPPPPAQHPGRRRPATSYCTVWNVMMSVLALFFCYIILNSWVQSFISGDFRGLAISVCLLLLASFACWKSRKVFLRRAALRAALANELNSGGDQRAAMGIPVSVRKSYEVFKYEAPLHHESSALSGAGATQGGDYVEAGCTAPMYTIGGVGVVSGVPVTPVSPGEHQLHASAAARTAGGVSGRLHDAKARLGDSGTQDVELGVTTSTAVATSELQCVICLGDYTTGESLCRLPCPFQHVYHVECINLWLDGHSTCPYCKYDLMLAAEEEQSPSATAMPPRAIATSAGSNAEPTYWPAV